MKKLKLEFFYLLIIFTNFYKDIKICLLLFNLFYFFGNFLFVY